MNIFQRILSFFHHKAPAASPTPPDAAPAPLPLPAASAPTPAPAALQLPPTDLSPTSPQAPATPLSTTSQATPPPSSPAPQPVVQVLPTSSVPSESFASWLQRTHPDLFLNALGAYQMATNPFIAAGLSNEAAYNAAISRSGPAQARADWTAATDPNSLAPLSGKLLSDMTAMHAGAQVNGKGPGTDAYTELVSELRASGLNEADIAGYINKYAPK